MSLRRLSDRPRLTTKTISVDWQRFLGMYRFNLATMGKNPKIVAMSFDSARDCLVITLEYEEQYPSWEPDATPLNTPIQREELVLAHASVLGGYTGKLWLVHDFRVVYEPEVSA
jgi:hypothetical protein